MAYQPPQGPQHPHDPYEQPSAPYQQPSAPYQQGQPPSYPPAPYQSPYPPQYPQQAAIAPKSSGVALLISFFLPGVGSLYAGNTKIGLIILIGWIISWVLIVVLIGYPLVFGFWVWGMIAGYQDAQRWNQAHGIIS